ncbi:hypothetical protein [Saccharomonospora sp. CUA-673]|uniref:hypothetical protein n=1 Tax=Saccharomonospora sp. CUA-673 TaxID=1904969 RepID=UPI001C9E583B|nr:hypothetical protein [Saccharomonospora sp. CUA-673]
MSVSTDQIGPPAATAVRVHVAEPAIESATAPGTQPRPELSAARLRRAKKAYTTRSVAARIDATRRATRCSTAPTSRPTPVTSSWPGSNGSACTPGWRAR